MLAYQSETIDIKSIALSAQIIFGIKRYPGGTSPERACQEDWMT
jgi:hypothetical protein